MKMSVATNAARFNIAYTQPARTPIIFPNHELISSVIAQPVKIGMTIKKITKPKKVERSNQSSASKSSTDLGVC